MCTEVEHVVRSVVTQTLSSHPSLQNRVEFFTDKFIGALERDAKWVETFEITGSLEIPAIEDDGGQGESEVLQCVRDVCLVLFSLY